MAALKFEIDSALQRCQYQNDEKLKQIHNYKVTTQQIGMNINCYSIAKKGGRGGGGKPSNQVAHTLELIPISVALSN